ncbi:glycosyltransferase family 4 protein [Dolichospermum heterosporum]|uniref:Glycosyltransferase family 4 protein n=1 Tax=Dolichospermum heterosporum TAC447 TaxID=747523 RepID=A0ABY5M3M7_9CYAN|nr:glycosyltransferase family 4 protein [Dolichospermum heterosporum]UUO17809.1 glycosyltransferase family 4 protein [Dolichospermum heterosporum TAC447]
MKILLITDYATPTGGAEIQTIALRDGLRSRGHDARLFASSACPLNAQSQADYHCLGTTSRLRTLLQTANFWAFGKLKQILAEFQPDVVHVTIFLTQLSPLILPLLKNIPSLYYAVWYRSMCPIGTKILPNGTACQVKMGMACYQNHCLPLRDWLPLMIQMKLWQRWSNAFNLFVAPSQAVKKYLIGAGINSVEIVWNGTPIQRQRPPLSSPPTVVFAARLVKEKGAEVLLKAFALVVNQIPEARLLLLGDGAERETLHQQIIDLDIATNVLMYGFMSRIEMEKLFSVAWVQVVPSLWPEPFGMVVIEAMMRGTAVIASAIGGLAEIVQNNQTGLLVPPGDSQALAAALLRILQNQELAEQMGQRGRQLAIDQYRQDKYVDNFLELYQILHANYSREQGTGNREQS